MISVNIPDKIPNWIDGQERAPLSGDWFEKKMPTNGQLLCQVARSNGKDVNLAIQVAQNAQSEWAGTTVVRRSDILREIAIMMRHYKKEIASIVAAETGKSMANALGETDAAIEMGFFVAGEGRRYYGRTTTASMAHRAVMSIRQPVGIAGLIIASNTPIANVAWKAFPSILCGNASILKPSEDTPATAWIFGKICQQAGLPIGVLNIVQGFGPEAGAPLVSSPDVDLISFTGSCETGRQIQKIAGERLAKVCLELGGKNALVVCDDADLSKALHWTLQSAFSNAGQRCAAASRIIVFDAIYEKFKASIVTSIKSLSVGPEDTDFLGPVINEKQLNKMIEEVHKAVAEGSMLLTGGDRLQDASHKNGYYMAPTLLENVDPNAEISKRELFGPITILYRVSDLLEALTLANNSPYGLTTAIHTKDLNRSMYYAEQAEVGVVIINGGTFGSESHMGFGGVKNSGTGWREAGLEALDVYSEWKYIHITSDPNQI